MDKSSKDFSQTSSSSLWEVKAVCKFWSPMGTPFLCVTVFYTTLADHKRSYFVFLPKATEKKKKNLIKRRNRTPYWFILLSNIVRKMYESSGNVGGRFEYVVEISIIFGRSWVIQLLLATAVTLPWQWKELSNWNVVWFQKLI